MGGDAVEQWESAHLCSPTAWRAPCLQLLQAVIGCEAIHEKPEASSVAFLVISGSHSSGHGLAMNR